MMNKLLLSLLLLIPLSISAQNNIYTSGGISQTVGPPTYTPGRLGNVVAIDTATGYWYVTPNRLSGAAWLGFGFPLANISGSVPPAFTPTKFQPRFVINAVDSMYWYDGSAWKHVNKVGGGGISGIANYIPKFNSSTTVDTSGLYWVGGKLGLRTVAPNGLLEIKGTAATDTATQLGAELLTTGTGTGWTGTSFASGYTHTSGTTALTANSLTVISATTYTLVVTVTGRTVGTCTVTVGGLTTGAINTNTTVTVRGSTTATTNLSVATTSTFNGTVVVSLKLALPTTPSIALENARGNISLEIRSSKDSTNTAIGLNALGQVTTGYGNYVYGFDAAKNITTGYNNILIGPVNTITTGFRNVIITPSSTSYVTTGNSNIHIGFQASPSSGTVSNEIVIAQTQTGLGSNTTIIGRAASTTRTHIAGALTTTTGNITSISNIAQLYSQGSTTTSAGKALVVENSTPTSLYEIRNDGKISYLATNTAAGTTGAQTIDRPSGTVNFAAGASALVVTNSLVSTTSIVFAVVRANDSTAYVKNVVPAAGSFTINLGAAATAETSVGFWVIN